MIAAYNIPDDKSQNQKRGKYLSKRLVTSQERFRMKS